MAYVYPFDVAALLKRWHLGDKLQRLARLSPNDVKGIELIVDDALIHRWPRPASTRRPRRPGVDS